MTFLMVSASLSSARTPRPTTSAPTASTPANTNNRFIDPLLATRRPPGDDPERQRLDGYDSQRPRTSASSVRAAPLAGIEPAIDWTDRPLFPLLLAAATGRGRFDNHRNDPPVF